MSKKGILFLLFLFAFLAILALALVSEQKY
jgi:hypothetical protein